MPKPSPKSAAILDRLVRDYAGVLSRLASIDGNPGFIEMDIIEGFGGIGAEGDI